MKEKIESDKLFSIVRHRVIEIRQKEEISSLSKKCEKLTIENQKFERDNQKKELQIQKLKQLIIKYK